MTNKVCQVCHNVFRPNHSMHKICNSVNCRDEYIKRKEKKKAKTPHQIFTDWTNNIED